MILAIADVTSKKCLDYLHKIFDITKLDELTGIIASVGVKTVAIVVVVIRIGLTGQPQFSQETVGPNPADRSVLDVRHRSPGRIAIVRVITGTVTCTIVRTTVIGTTTGLILVVIYVPGRVVVTATLHLGQGNITCYGLSRARRKNCINTARHGYVWRRNCSQR